MQILQVCDYKSACCLMTLLFVTLRLYHLTLIHQFGNTTTVASCPTFTAVNNFPCCFLYIIGSFVLKGLTSATFSFSWIHFKVFILLQEILSKTFYQAGSIVDPSRLKYYIYFALEIKQFHKNSEAVKINSVILFAVKYL